MSHIVQLNKDTRIKVLFIHHEAGWGGAPINMYNIIQKLDKSIYSPKVLLIRDSEIKEILADYGIKCEVTKSSFYRKYYRFFTYSEAGYTNPLQLVKFIKLSLYWLLSRFYFAEKELKQHEFDIVHLNSSVLTDWLAPASKLGKVIYHVREPFRKGRLDLLHLFFKYQIDKYSDKIIAISEDNAKRIGLPDKTEVIYNFASAPENEIKINSYKSKSVLYLGGASSIKGFFTIVDALDYLDSDIRILFCGNYQMRHKPKNRVKLWLKKMRGNNILMNRYYKKMRTSENTVEIGFVNDVDKYLSDCCCLISPFSKPHFSRPIIEAHLHKKPVIATNIPGMDEQVRHNIDGILVEKDNPEELAEAINLLCNNPELCKKMGEAGYSQAIMKFTSKNVKRIEEIYIKLTKNDC